jgi:RNA polymerase sigma factor (sigma-70 family)
LPVGVAAPGGAALVDQPLTVSAEAVVLGGEEREEVIRAVGRLPHRQREALVLRFYLDLPDDQIARVMGIGQGTVRSTTCRALEALGRALKETS